jgi:RNA polymerase sigma factor (sigma-70 family)
MSQEEAARRAMRIALRTAAGIMGSRDDAADVAQDVAVDVLKSLDHLRNSEAFDAWVYKITVRHTMRALRKQNGRSVEVPFGLGVPQEGTALDEPDRDMVLTARGALGQALLTLPPRQRVVLALRYIHDLSDREIAAALGCRRGTVNALLSRARATLRAAPALQALEGFTEGRT